MQCVRELSAIDSSFPGNSFAKATPSSRQLQLGVPIFNVKNSQTFAQLRFCRWPRHSSFVTNLGNLDFNIVDHESRDIGLFEQNAEFNSNSSPNRNRSRLNVNAKFVFPHQGHFAKVFVVNRDYLKTPVLVENWLYVLKFPFIQTSTPHHSVKVPRRQQT